jgi:hypothetical protein
MEAKAWQPELIRQRRNVEPGQHSGGLLDIFRAHGTMVVFLVEDFSDRDGESGESSQECIVTLVICQRGQEVDVVASGTER